MSAAAHVAIAPGRLEVEVAAAYEQYRQSGDRTILKQCAVRLGVPKWRVTHLGVRLGLARVKEKPWSPEELEVLYRHVPYTPAVIARKLHEAGFQRTEAAVLLKRKRLKLRYLPGLGFSARQVADALGVDSHKVTEWIRAGLLKATHRGTRRIDRQHGDDYYIERAAVRSFLLGFPEEWPIYRVEKAWLLEILCADYDLIGDAMEEHF